MGGIPRYVDEYCLGRKKSNVSESCDNLPEMNNEVKNQYMALKQILGEEKLFQSFVDIETNNIFYNHELIMHGLACMNRNELVLPTHNTWCLVSLIRRFITVIMIGIKLCYIDYSSSFFVLLTSWVIQSAFPIQQSKYRSKKLLVCGQWWRKDIATLSN